jgi:hypothetical protein
LRFKESGLGKYAVWRKTWDLQRQEDATGQRLDIPSPPKYQSADFRSPVYWRLRGKLDVPKEAFVSFPGAERASDSSLVIGWAGWNDLQLVTAMAAHLLEASSQEGWTKEKALPLLVALQDRVPWVKQWHNEVDPEFQQRMGHYYERFVLNQSQNFGCTLTEIEGWTPPAGKPRAARSPSAAKKSRRKTP